MSIRISNTECKYGLFQDIPKINKTRKKRYKLIRPDYCPVCDCETYINKGNNRLCTKCGNKW